MRYLYIPMIMYLLLSIQVSCQKERSIEIPVEVSFADPDSLLTTYQKLMDKQVYGFEFTWNSKQGGFYAGYLDIKDVRTADFLIDVFPQIRNLGYQFAIQDKKPCLTIHTGGFPAEMKDFFSGLDSSFSILSVKGDTLVMRGNRYGDEFLLVPNSLSQQQAYLQGGVQKTIATIQTLNRLPKYFKRIVYNGAAYDLQVNPALRKLYINYGLVDRFKFFESSYAYTATGIRLANRFSEDINSFAGIEIQLEAGSNKLLAKINGSSMPISNEGAPSAYDYGAAKDFITHPFHQLSLNLGNNTSLTQPFSASFGGFTVGGVQDAYGVSQMDQYGYVMLLPRWLNEAYGTLRVFSPTTGIGSYGPAFYTQYSPNGGLLGFQYIGEFGETPAMNKPHWDLTTAAFLDLQGFYVIRSGAASYDLVSVNQLEQKWIRFE